MSTNQMSFQSSSADSARRDTQRQPEESFEIHKHWQVNALIIYPFYIVIYIHDNALDIDELVINWSTHSFIRTKSLNLRSGFYI